MTPSHRELVERVCDDVRARPAGKRLTVAKRHPGHRPHDLAYKRDAHPVRVDGLNRILAVDGVSRTVTVEGQVTLGELCKVLLAERLMPKVVPEFETFTVSGLVNGLGIETSSHRHGTFPAALRSLEVVLGNGEVVEATREQHADLLANLPGSYGTMGIVTCATLELSVACPYVRSRYVRFTDLGKYVEAFGAALQDNEFVEGFVFARDLYVLVTGNYAQLDESLAIYEASVAGNEWYYQHARSMAAQGGEDLVPTHQYMFRHQRSTYWITGIIADSSLLSNTRAGRRFLDQQTLKKVSADGFKTRMPPELYERCLVHQDMGVRLSRLAEGIAYVQENFGVYPLWNCASGNGTLPLEFVVPRAMKGQSDMVVDIGVYGEPTVRGFRTFDAARALQKFVDVPALWGVSYLSSEELREIYDFDSLEALQRRYHNDEAFMPLIEKLRFMRPEGAKQTRLPAWRLGNLWYDLTS